MTDLQCHVTPRQQTSLGVESISNLRELDPKEQGRKNIYNSWMELQNKVLTGCVRKWGGGDMDSEYYRDDDSNFVVGLKAEA